MGSSSTTATRYFPLSIIVDSSPPASLTLLSKREGIPRAGAESIDRLLISRVSCLSAAFDQKQVDVIGQGLPADAPEFGNPIKEGIAVELPNGLNKPHNFARVDGIAHVDLSVEKTVRVKQDAIPTGDGPLLNFGPSEYLWAKSPQRESIEAPALDRVCLVARDDDRVGSPGRGGGDDPTLRVDAQHESQMR